MAMPSKAPSVPALPVETNFSYTELIITGPSGTTRLDGVIEFTRGRNGSAFFSDQIHLSFTKAEVSGATLTNYNVTLSGSGDTDSTDALQPDAIVTRRLSSNFSLTADPWDENIRLRCLDNTNDAAPSEFQFSCGD